MKCVCGHNRSQHTESAPHECGFEQPYGDACWCMAFKEKHQQASLPDFGVCVG